MPQKCNLACIHRDREGVPWNFKVAFQWFTKAAEQGAAKAQCSPGCLYASGHGGIDRDPLEPAGAVGQNMGYLRFRP